MSEERLILRQDACGRVVVPVERQVELVREYERGGLSGPKFAALAGVKYQTFATWRRKHGSGAPVRERSRRSERTESVGWMEAVVERPVGAGLILRLPGGVTAEITRPDQVVLVVELLKAMGSKPC